MDKKMPKIAQGVFVAPGAAIAGDVTIGEQCSVWYNATIRADDEPIVIGQRTNVQDNAVLHVDFDYPLVIGDGVTIGHGAIVHGCTVGDNTLIGMGAIILNGAKIGNNCIIGAGALVTQNKEIPDGSLVMGTPGKIVRELDEKAIESIRVNGEAYLQTMKEYQEGLFGDNLSEK